MTRAVIIGPGLAGIVADIDRALDRMTYVANRVVDEGRLYDKPHRLPPPQAPTYSPPPIRTGNRERDRRARQEARRIERATRPPPSGLAAGGGA